MKDRIEDLLREIEREKASYNRLLKKGEKVRRRERDTFLTEKDRTILIESFVVGGLIENLITKAINRIF
ncbi:MAG: hypothetical protein AB1353_04345 [Aquificota bacterium]|jgi:hypothetical protein|nr:hypothetical protein [Aquificaceae bacterium]MDM7266108.1 hypothetical protein [Aquificaceae bacterium]QWK12640.1 MAG: hypothetical protein KNN14_07225 [Aquificota bacterium]HAV39758.1 hypothetical protein [Aquificaceae bacterium]HCO38907.1 hypothetical protein [Aquificaceae bacterium]